MYKLLLNLITFGLKPLYEKNISYYNLIAEFRNKLPRSQNKARRLTEEEKIKYSFDKSLREFSIMTLNSHKTSLTEKDLDVFMNTIETFNYKFIFFKKHYKSFSDNILRLNPKSEDGNFDLVVLQEILKDDPINRPLKPLDVFCYHLKHKYKFSSRIAKWICLIFICIIIGYDAKPIHLG